MILYKRNQKGKPIQWQIEPCGNNVLPSNMYVIRYGIVGKKLQEENIVAKNNVDKEISSLIKFKKKEGYKELKELRDNAPEDLSIDQLESYLDTYLPKFNISDNGAILPMLCKTLENNNPFDVNDYRGQYKINGERCLVGAVKSNDMFCSVRLTFQSRYGTYWYLPYLEDYLLVMLPKSLIDRMIEEDFKLDGEIYLPGYTINLINSFIKNPSLPQHKLLQYWIYDIAIDNMIYNYREHLLLENLNIYKINELNKDEHLNNTQKLILLPSYQINDINEATEYRDKFINNGFEGLVIRNINAEYGFNHRNNNMMKYKKLYDGNFTIIDIIPEGSKRSNLPKFICLNDINENTFECTIKGSFKEQEKYLINKKDYIGKKLFVEYRERSGINEIPFHAKACYIIDK